MRCSAPLEGIGAVLISQIRQAVNEESGHSSAEAAGSVGAGNVEVRSSPICPEIGVLGGNALSQIANVGVQKQVGAESIGAADSDGRNQGRGCRG